MSALLELAARCEAASGPDRELDALIRCAVFAPAAAYVKQSPINGAWCIYEERLGRERDWEPRGLSQLQRLGELTASLDAAMTLVPQHALWHVGSDIDGPTAIITRPVGDGYIGGAMSSVLAATPALALTAAALRARAAQDQPA